MRVNPISLKEIEFVTFRLARQLMSQHEPIPDFDSRYPQKLESCSAVPFQTFARKSLYPELLDKAGILFYLMIKNHPFANGNKRIAMMTLFTFLYNNNLWIRVDTHELYEFAKWVAASNATIKDEVVAAIKGFLQKHLVRL